MRMAGNGPHLGGQRGHQGRPRRGRQLDRQVDAVGEGAGEQLDHGGRRVGQQPVGRPHHAGPGGDRAGPDLVHAQHFQGGGGADHVDDGVEPADLVEVDLLGRPPVQPPLDVGQRPERPQRPGGDPRRRRRASSTRR